MCRVARLCSIANRWNGREMVGMMMMTMEEEEEGRR